MEKASRNGGCDPRVIEGFDEDLGIFDGQIIDTRPGKRWPKTMERSTIFFYGNINYFYGPSSIAMLSYKRVTNDIMLFGFAQVYYGISWYIMVYPNTMVIPTMQKINVSISLVNPGSSGESTKWDY